MMGQLLRILHAGPKGKGIFFLLGAISECIMKKSNKYVHSSLLSLANNVKLQKEINKEISVIHTFYV